MEEFYNYFERHGVLDDETKDLVLKLIKVIKIKKGDLLISQNQSFVNKTYFVLKGCLRSFYVDQNSKEHTLQFSIKGWWISDYIAFYGGQEAVMSIQALTDSVVIEATKQNIELVFEKYPHIESIHRKYLETKLVVLNKRVLNQLNLSARDRYLKFLDEFPQIQNYAQNYHIASYLGITQQSLSRIRSEK